MKIFGYQITISKPKPAVEPDMERVSLEVDDTYEAAYYMHLGGRVVGFREHRMASNSKKPFRTLWILEMEDVPRFAIDKYKQGKASAPVKSIKVARFKIKKKIGKIKSSEYRR